MGTGIPFWLDLKTGYVDENIDRILEYMKKSSVSGEAVEDSLYRTTADLIEKRVSEMLAGRDSMPLYAGNEKEVSEEACIRDLKIYGAYILCIREGNEVMMLRTCAAFLATLLGIMPDNIAENLYSLALDCIIGTRNLVLQWDDLIGLRPQVLAAKLVSGSIRVSGKNEYIFEGKGIGLISGGSINVSARSAEYIRQKIVVPVFSLSEDRLNVLSEKSDRIGSKAMKDMDSLDYFTTLTIRELSTYKPKVRKQNVYQKDDFLEVAVTGKHNGHLQVRSIDNGYEEIAGEVLFRELNKTFLYYNESDFLKNLDAGDIIEVQYTGSGFEIGPAFIRLIVETYRNDRDISFLAMVKNIWTDRKGNKKIQLWSELGFPVFANEERSPEVSVGDMTRVRIRDFGKDKYYGIINVDIEEVLSPYEDSYMEDMEKVDDAASKHECIRWSVIEPERKVSSEDSIIRIGSGILKDICRMLLAYQETSSLLHEKYALLCFARILSEMTGDRTDSSYMEFLSDYLVGIARFSKGEISEIRQLEKPASLTGATDGIARKIDMISVLSCYGMAEKNDFLDEMIERAEDPVLKKTATLIQSGNRLREFIGSSMKDQIKREILKALSVSGDPMEGISRQKGMYLGVESDSQEFKSSFFTAPQNAAEQRQPVTIMKGICAFLNSEDGGTIFIGVNDAGYVSGLAEDLDYLDRKVRQAYSGIDGLVRYITDTVKKYFGQEIALLVNIRQICEGQALALEIKPADRLVEIEGDAYIRVNNETNRMKEAAKQNLRTSRLHHENKSLKENLNNIVTAISNEMKVVLHGYCSSNSGEISDRNVEPFSLCGDSENVWCYDLDKERNSVFKISRIRHVEITDKPWSCRDMHHEKKMDIFRMTGEDEIPVVLELDLRARNILLEEYPSAGAMLSPAGDDNKWILKTDVYSLEGIGRFYIGLAGDIRIIDAPGLKDYAEDYVSRYIVPGAKHAGE